ncbi:MAG: retron St85 family RNA-directed DNA polymerase [Spirochaetes bacterium]|nr:retron St85 family RNA-directed DNA polymerase [Spirochaetota bacterium]
MIMNNPEYNLYKLSDDVGVSIKFLKYIIHNKPKYYATFDIDKKSGKRTICAPRRELKTIQRNILDKILNYRLIHPKSHGFQKERSIFTNVAEHKNKKIVLKLDLHDFFPSIKFNKVCNLFKSFKLKDDVVSFLTELTTYNGELPQGAPTSPYISNLICKKMDYRLNALALKSRLSYSRYADDLTFSGDKIKKSTIALISKIIREEGFGVNRTKTRFMSQKGKQSVTGLVVNKKVGIGRKKYRVLRAIVHNCEQMGMATQNKENHPKFKEYLLGKISLLKNTDLDKWTILKNKIDSLDWDSYSPKIDDKHDLIIDVSTKIIDLMDELNNLTDTNIFKESNEKTKNIFLSCSNRDNFSSRTQILFTWIDEMDTIYFKNKIKTKTKGSAHKKSIVVVKEYLNCIDIDSSDICEVWNDINLLAAGIHRHRHQKIKDAVYETFKKYKFDEKDPNYSLFWLKILVSFRLSLSKLWYAIKKEQSNNR